jgi:ankyrin repeat protein
MALHEIAEKQHETILRLLLKYKADVDAKNYFERTALHEAAWGRHEAA